ncbi:hypothetical protein TKWG_07085 [Advenella kashmirensis WT001]|uniref:Uncharacterized protein n=1 Tax=Advenella kashmirensis (strain DSM 17095 / LMG 22695 / WT001) TaxID=1036672 RepID=I3UA12_ADVKW|nr:hypothetical protein TKWG_07085 [Advenella kashmirensis WT001]
MIWVPLRVFVPGVKFGKRDCNVFAQITPYPVVFSNEKAPEGAFSRCGAQAGVAPTVQSSDQ